MTGVFDPAVFDGAVFDTGTVGPPGVSIDAGGMLTGRRARGGGGATVAPDLRTLRPVIEEIERLLREPPQPKKGRVKKRVEVAPEAAADLADRLEAVARVGPASQLADRLARIRARQALFAADLELAARALEQLRAIAAMLDEEDAFMVLLS
jgi:hypothetical protein